MKLFTRIAFAVALIIATSISLAPSVSFAQSANVAGNWDASMNTPGGARPFGLEIKVDSATKLTGTVKRPNGDVPLEGTIKGNDITFSYTIVYNDNPLTLTVTAKVDGDTMKGTVSFGGQAEDEFSATRAKKTP